MKGIILAGGTGSRLYPVTKGISKQLMPIYDKPMIYYPISTLLQAGINEILIITTPSDQNNFKNLLGDGKSIGCNFEFAAQPTPDGIAQAFIIAEKFIGKDSVCLILGDNLFYGSNLNQILEDSNNPNGGIVFACHVSDPERYGVVEFDTHFNALSIEEKPKIPKSNYAISGIYFYDNSVVEIAKNIVPSPRGELEITDVNIKYLEQKKLKVKLMERGIAWLDTGTFASFNQASQFVQVIEDRQGLKIGCIEEVAYNKGFINENQLKELANPLLKSGYGEYLLSIIK
ncbi:MAG: glucose-1-phosphate thymidylyltransferase RfbA [candidate division SR1 bacterium]|nr:glucose-1-phosphate thymidylyltransferase RfbA [candidate division SR1 bacterium]